MGVLGEQIKSLMDDLYDGSLISDFGFALSATLKIRAQGTYNTTTGTQTPTNTDYTVKALISEYTAQHIAGSGGLIRTGDICVKVRATTAITSITPDCQIVVNGITYQIVHVEPKLIDGTVYEFVCQSRASR